MAEVLIPNIPFVSGQVWNTQVADLAFNQVFDDQTQFLGHRPRLDDDSLSNDPDNIKPRVADFQDSLLVEVVSGRNLKINAGTLVLPDGTIQNNAEQLLTFPPNTSAFLYVDVEGNVQTSATPPSIRLLLAEVETNLDNVIRYEDLRHLRNRYVSSPSGGNTPFGGLSPTNYTALNGDVLPDGRYYYKDFIVPVGVSITITQFAEIYCSGIVDISGTVLVTPAGRGTPQAFYNLSARTSVALQPTHGQGNQGLKYPWTTQRWGNGGSAPMPWLDDAAGVNLAPGGEGGGGLIIEAADTITVSGSILAPGATSAFTSFVGNTTPGVFQAGVGGIISGAGGGGGGTIFLGSGVSIDLQGSSYINASGANGQNAISNVADIAGAQPNVIAHGGAGGGGGYVYLAAPSITQNGLIDITGGFNGQPSGDIDQQTGDIYYVDNTSGVIAVSNGLGGGNAGNAGFIVTDTATDPTRNIYQNIHGEDGVIRTLFFRPET